MKRIDINEIMIGIFESGRSFEELTEVEQMVLALKEALEQIKTLEEGKEKVFIGVFIGKLAGDLKSKGVII